MKRGLKIFISIIMVLMVFCCTVLIDYQKAYAIGLSDLDFFYDLITNEDAPYSLYRQAIYKSITSDMGLIVGNLTEWQLENERKIVAKYLKNKYGTEKTAEEVTDEEVRNFYNDYRQNISVNKDNHSITYNDNSRMVLNTIADTYKSESPFYYAYTFNENPRATSFSNGDLWAKYSQVLKQYQSTYYLLYNIGGGSSEMWVWGIEKTKCNFYGTLNNLSVVKDNWEIPTDADGVICKHIKLANGVVTEEDVSQPLKNRGSTSLNGGQATSAQDVTLTLRSYQRWWVTCGNECILVWRSLADFKNSTLGRPSYYVNNTVYNSWKNSTGDYTINTDNSNHATYGDVNTYVDDHHTETGTYPSPEEINVYIENKPAPTPEPTPTPTPDNPSGGGSGSGSTVSGNGSGGNNSATATAQGGQGGQASANNEGINITINNNHNINLGGGKGLSGNTVSGNGSGSSGGIGGIFDFLSQIGDFLGSLIKNIGNVLADIVTGIGSVIGSLLQGIPTVFNDFLGGVLGWLPPELKALITLSISAMIIVGLIKLLRG